MNAILLINGRTTQASARLRKAAAPRVPPQPAGFAADTGPQDAVSARADLQADRGASYLQWTGSGAGVETALFVSVQAVMIACVVVVAAQLFAMA